MGNFMSSKMDSDPLLNPSSNHNQQSINKQQQQQTSQHHHNNFEYMPSNTMIRLSNKKVIKLSELCVGDKILSLCINSYPNSTNSNHSFLPKPINNKTKATTLSNNGSIIDKITNSKKQKMTKSEKEKRIRARTTVNGTVPFMLPPPIQRTHHSQQNASSHQQNTQSNVPRKSLPFIAQSEEEKSDNFLAQSVTKVVNEEYIKKSKGRSKSVAVNSIHSLYQNHINQKKKMHRLASNGSYHKHRSSQTPSLSYKNGAKSQNNSPRNSVNGRTQHFNFSQQQKQTKNSVKRARFSTANIEKKRNSVRRSSNYLESVKVLKIVENKIYKIIEIHTENDWKIRCTPTHLFWICGKGWGCYDVAERKCKKDEKVHRLQNGELLLTVSGKKYKISYINVIDKPQGLTVFSIIVSKNDCFFANDLLVKNSIY